MKFGPLTLALAASLMLGAGCARLDVSSDLKESGGLDRSIRMTLSTQNMSPGDPDVDPATILKLEKPGDWKTTRSMEGTDQVYTATRTYAAAPNASKEFTLFDGTEDNTVCTVTVTKSGKTLTYREVHTWVGPPPEKSPPMEEAKQVLKESLPVGAMTDGEANALAEQLAKDAWRIVFGPAQPILSDLMTNPSLGMRRLRMRLGEKMMERLKTAAPDLTEEQRTNAVIKFGQKFSDIQAQQSGGPSEEEASGNSFMLVLDCSVKGPGRLVSTNGEHDIITGRVYWSFAADAAALEPVVLEAVYELP